MRQVVDYLKNRGLLSFKADLRSKPKAQTWVQDTNLPIGNDFISITILLAL